MNEKIRLDDSTVFNPQTGEFGTLPQILIFTTDKNILVDETPAIVSWTVSNATVIKLNGESVDPTGTKEYHSIEPLTLTLSASNDAGSAEPKTITIDIDRTEPVIHFFKATPQVAIKGSPVVLSWNVEGGYKIEIGGIGVGTSSSSKTITLGDNGIFTLIAKNYFGIESEAVTSVTVFPTPVIESLKVPMPDFTNKVSLNPIQISSPKIDVSLNLDNIYLEKPKFTEPSFDLKSIKTTHMSKTSILEFARLYEQFKSNISKRLRKLV